MDEEKVASASTSSTLLPGKKSRKGKNTLKTVSLEEPEGTPDQSSPSGPNKNTRRIWKHKDLEEFQVPDSRFEPRDNTAFDGCVELPSHAGLLGP